MKSLCIKTNNSNLLDYLQNELNSLDLDNVCFSCNQFKHYKNIIIHYTGKDTDLFINKLSSILSLLVIDEIEEDLLNRILLQNYFYFDVNERKNILNLCFDVNINDFTSIFDKKFKILYNNFYKFIKSNHSIFLNGFINFRIKEYLSILDDIVNEAVNSYIVEKEYLEFISLLKLYINSQPSNANLIHMIYSNSETILLDEEKNIITTSEDMFKAKYLSDISFSANDYALNSLLTLLPKKVYVHLVDNYIDEFISTIQAIFENKVEICTDCEICRLYKHSNKTAKKDPFSI